MFDLACHKDLDHIFFEIWKRVAKEKVRFLTCARQDQLAILLIWYELYYMLNSMIFLFFNNIQVGFTDALEDLYKLNLYPLQQEFIKAEFEERPLRSIKMKEAVRSFSSQMI